KIHRICGDLAPAPEGRCSFRGTCQKPGTSGVSVTAAAVERPVSDRTKNGVVDDSGEKHRTGSVRIRRVPVRLFGYCEGPGSCDLNAELLHPGVKGRSLHSQ